MKRYFYLWHRWLGIGLCLLMALWFVSGMVMLYVGYPKLTPAEHLTHLPELPARDCCIDLAQVFAASGRDDAPQSLRLSSAEGRPRYLLGYADGSGVTLDALDGRRIEAVDEAGALASARQFDPRATAHYLGLVDEDAWTHSRALDGDRPLHRVQLDDAEGRQLYISSHSGAVVRDATRTERAWNWIGAWLHWLYPLRGPWWSNLVIYSALAATAMALLGQVVGVLRWRFSRPYRSGSRSPYRGGFARWHHIGGLLFGGVVIAWIFSGLMSMRPWHLLDSQSRLTASAYQGGALRAEAFPLPVREALARFRQAGLQPRELEWRMVGGEGVLQALESDGNSRVLAMDDANEPLRRLPESTLRRAVQAMSPGTAMDFDELPAYDFYYFARAEQSMNGGLQRPLPVLRVRVDDAAGTWLHIDPRSGALLEQLDERRRLARWLFNLLHSWDWQPLLQRPLLRDVLMLAFSLGGLVISLSGVVLGWRRLRKRRRA